MIAERFERWSPSTKAWAVGGAALLAYEILCPPGQTLSEGCDRARETRLGKYLVPGLIGATALHLLRVQRSLGHEWADPIHFLASFKEK